MIYVVVEGQRLAVRVDKVRSTISTVGKAGREVGTKEVESFYLC